MEHHVVAALPGRFAGWPANNGAFQFREDGSELLVGFTDCPFVSTDTGHNTVDPTDDEPQPYVSLLARSLNGGASWAVERPPNYVGRPASEPRRRAPGAGDFLAPGFAMRVVGQGYHGAAVPEGGFYTTHDRGASWDGPFTFEGLAVEPELAGMEITARTCTVVESTNQIAALLSARPINGDGLNVVTDKTFTARTEDGGASWCFCGWLIPLTDPYRAVMPAVTVLGEGHWVVALRRRDVAGDGAKTRNGWIDVVITQDAGASWCAPILVGETGLMNGNPPALCDTGHAGGLCCVYGERNTRRMLARFSHDGGRGWGAPLTLRDDYVTAERMADLGYPRLQRRHGGDGKLVATYYWADKATTRQHIAATIFEAPGSQAAAAL